MFAIEPRKPLRLLLAVLMSLVLTIAAVDAQKSEAAPPGEGGGGEVSTGPVVAADALGRELVSHDEAPAPRADRSVGVFYVLWHGSNDAREYKNIFNNTEALADDPEAWRDADSGAFPPPGHFTYWGEPAFGYYRSDDEWVMRRHLQMLSDADVDYLVLDTSNTELYKAQAALLMELIVEFQADGIDAPQVMFMTHTGSTEQMDELYRTFYAPDAPLRHPSTWYMWDGKPAIMGENPSETVSEFFTFRHAQWPNEPQSENGWDWISFERPQRGNYTPDGTLEQMAVSPAQNSGSSSIFSNTAWYGVDDPASKSRAFHDGAEDPDPEAAVIRGANFQEQWDHVIEQDPETVLVLEWNEWIAGNWASSPQGPMIFYDVVDQRWSRDLEPMMGGYGDNYYLQMMDSIRRYKGVNPPDNVSAEKSITLRAGFQQWSDVGPLYRDYAGDTADRNHPGVGAETYVNETGRNDIVEAKVARDASDIHFMANTSEKLTKPDDKWMHLYLDSNGSLGDNWSGYDHRVVFDDAGQGMLQEFSQGQWDDVQEVDSRKGPSALSLSIPRAVLGLDGNPFRVAFKWWDNPGEDVDAAYTTGDAAPDGRFSYLYDTATHPEGAADEVPAVRAPVDPRKGKHRIDDASAVSDFESSVAGTSWVVQEDEDSSGGTYSQLHNPAGAGDSFYKTLVRAGFRGDSVRWIAPTGPQGTQAEVFVDGLSQGVVDLYSPEWQSQQTVFAVQGLPSGYHEVMVVFAKQAGTYYHDAFEFGVDGSGAVRTRSPLEAGRMAWATASGFTPTQFRATNPAQASDGSVGTWWTGTSTAGDHLQLDLGVRTVVRELHLVPRAESQSTVERFHVEVLATNGRWQTIASGTRLDEPVVLKVRPVKADAVRLVVDESVGGPPEIAEFSLGVPGADTSEASGWEFTNSTQGWTASGDLATPVWTEAGDIRSDASGVGALWSPDGLGIDAVEQSSVALGLRGSSGGGIAAVVFEAKAPDGTGTTGKQQFRVESVSSIRPYVVNMADAAGWEGTITRVGVEFVADGETVALDHLRVAPDHASWASHFNGGDDGWDVSGAVVGEAGPGVLALEAREDTIKLTAPEGISADLTNAGRLTLRAGGLQDQTTLTVGYTTSQSEGRRTLTREVTGTAGMQTLQVSMAGSPGWGGLLEELDITVSPVPEGSQIVLDAVRVEHFYLSSFAPRSTWDFEEDTEGWTAGFGISGFAWAEPGVVSGDMWYSDARIMSEDYLQFDIADTTTVTIGLRNQTPGTTASLFFTTLSDGQFDAAKSITFPATPDDDGISTYVLDVGALPGWEGTLRQLRLDPVNGATGLFVLDYVRIS